MSIRITANRQDEEPERIVRLKKIAEMLAAKRVTNISGLHDHKGTLYVDWSNLPMSSELSEAIAAWRGENEALTNHSVNGKPLVWDVGGDNPFGGPSFP